MNSPNAQRSSPPRVVFLIDTHYPTTNQHDTARDLEELRLAVLRILLYFHDHVDRRVTWGYQFFNPNGHTNLRHRADFYELCVASLDTFTTALRSELDASQNDSVSSTPTTSNSPFTNLKTFLAQILSDFQWNHIDASFTATPIKQRRMVRKTSANIPVIVKNQLYVLTPAPRSHSELATFVDGKSELQTFLTLEGERKKVLNLLDRVREEILTKNLWNEYVEQRIAINWVDTAVVTQEQAERSAAQKDIDHFIQSYLASILRAFGGHLIPYVVLTEDLARHGLSFSSVFHHYRSASIDATVGIGMRARAKGGKRASGDASEAEKQEEPERSIWKGRVVVGVLEEEETICEAKLCPMISIPPQSFSADISNLLRDVIAIRILSHLPASRLRPSCFLTCDTQPNILFALLPSSVEERGLALLGLLEVVRGRGEVLLVTFDGRSEEETEAKVERRTTETMVGRVAVMEMVIEGCAAVRVMGEGVTEREMLEDDAGVDGEIQDSSQPHMPVEPLGTALFERWSGFSEVIPPMGTDPLFELDVSIPDDFDTAALVQQSNYSELLLHKQDGSGRCRKLLPLPDSGTAAEGVGARDESDYRVVRQPGPKNLEELLEKLKERYMETLYIENRSLADFAAHGLRSLDGHLTLLETDTTELKSKLLDHLRCTMLISLSKFEEKYHSAVNLTKVRDETAAREAADNAANLDPQERKYFKLWCRVQGTSAGGGSASVANGKLKMLKIREAQLQTLLLLEILCLRQQLGLDGSQSTTTVSGADKPTLSGSERSAGRKRKKKSGAEDDAPEAQLDLYFDRLCIWDTIDSIGAQIDETGGAGQIGREDDTVGMKRFWTEVVMKFYEQALPKTVASLWHKCGGDNLGIQSSPIRISKRTLSKKLVEPTKALSVKKLARRNTIAAADLASGRTSAALANGGGKAVDAAQPKRVGVPVNSTLLRREVEMVNRAGGSGKGSVAGLGDGIEKLERKAGAKRKVTTPKKIKINITGKRIETAPPKMKMPSTPTTPRTWHKDLGIDVTPTRRRSARETLGKPPRGSTNVDYIASTPRRRLFRTAPGELMPRDPYDAAWASPSKVLQTPERGPRKRLFTSPGEGDASKGTPMVEQTPERSKWRLDEELGMMTPVKRGRKRGREEIDIADPFVVVKETPVRRKRGGEEIDIENDIANPFVVAQESPTRRKRGVKGGSGSLV